MTNQFDDIKIASLDDSASGSTDPTTGLRRIVLNLSAPVPPEWASDFNDRWKSHFYQRKRNARVDGNRLEISCKDGELESDHFPEIERIIEQSNHAYRKFVTKKRQDEEAEAAKVAADKEKLKALKNNIKLA